MDGAERENDEDGGGDEEETSNPFDQKTSDVKAAVAAGQDAWEASFDDDKATEKTDEVRGEAEVKEQ